MTRQLLLFGLASAVVGGCGSVDGHALYRELGQGDAPEPGRDFLAAPATPGPGVSGPDDGEATLEDDAPLAPADTDAEPSDDTPPLALPVDDTPPVIEWTMPADGEVAVAAGVEIVIQFSEAMDRAATEAAYQGTLGDGVTFAWSRGATRLALRPAADLAYATGPEPLPALRYSVAFTGASDLAGNMLSAEPFSFATRRQVQVDLSPVQDPALTGSVRGDGLALSGECVTALCAGDASERNGGAPETQHKAFVSFDLDALPVSLIELVSAQLAVKIEDTAGDPFAGLGELHVERSDFERVGSAAFDADPDATLGVLAAGADHVTSGNIRWVVQEDLAAGRYSQFRLCFPQINDNDGTSDLVRFAPGDQLLSISYLAP
jgi:Big-like domain-containing protein